MLFPSVAQGNGPSRCEDAASFLGAARHPPDRSRFLSRIGPELAHPPKIAETVVLVEPALEVLRIQAV